MKLLPPAANFSPLVVTDRGTGFLCARTGELRKAFGLHVSPTPREVRPATRAEACAFFQARMNVTSELRAHYDRATARGDSTGD